MVEMPHRGRIAPGSRALLYDPETSRIAVPLMGTTLFRFESDCMPSVRVRENEPFEVALRRFKRTCEKAGVLTDLRSHEFFEKPSQERKRKRAAAVKRQAKRVSRETSRQVRMY